MTPEIIISIITVLGTMIASFGGILISNKLTTYRIEQLEKRVEKHNNLIERTALLERDQKSIWKRIDELRVEK